MNKNNILSEKEMFRTTERILNEVRSGHGFPPNPMHLKNTRERKRTT